MLFQDTEKIEEKVVRMLAARAPLAAKSVHCELLRAGGRGSLKAVYKALNSLMTQGVVVKSNRGFVLRLSWILSMTSLAEQMQQTYSSDVFEGEYFSDEGRRWWKFSSLHQLNSFWTNVILLMLRRSESRVMYDWVPHPWFYLDTPTYEQLFQQSLKRLGVETYRIVGGDTYLYRLPEADWGQVAGVTAFAPGPFEAKRDTYYVVVGDFVNRVRLDASLTERLERLYATAISSDKLDVRELSAVLHCGAKIVMTLERSPAKARRLARKFEQYFGKQL